MSITLTTSNSILLQNLITAGLILFPLVQQLCTNHSISDKFSFVGRQHKEPFFTVKHFLEDKEANQLDMGITEDSDMPFIVVVTKLWNAHFVVKVYFSFAFGCVDMFYSNTQDMKQREIYFNIRIKLNQECIHKQVNLHKC